MAEYIDAEMNYRKLADQIIVQAADDYRRALRVLRKYPNNSSAHRSKSEIESFFHSEWYCVLSNVDSDFLMKQIKKEVGYHDNN